MHRRKFLASIAACGFGPVSIADTFKYQPQVKQTQPAKSRPVRPGGQIAMIVPDNRPDTEWFLKEVPALQKAGYSFGGESDSHIFQITMSEANKRWENWPKYITSQGQSYPGWLFVVNNGSVPLKILKGKQYRVSWLTAGQRTATELQEWYESRIQMASQADATGRALEVASKQATVPFPRRQPVRNPVRRPGGQWTYFGGDSGDRLRNHLSTVHRVARDQLDRLSDRQLRIVHSNKHNGYPAFGQILKVMSGAIT